MSKGENIFKRKDGRWEARYIKGHDVSGKIKYGYCYGKTYKEAKEKVTHCKALLLNGEKIPVKKDKLRFSSYCDEWLHAGRSKFKDSTYVKYEGILERHIKPKLGNCYPHTITNSVITEFSEDLLYQKRLSAKTVKDILVILRSILKYTAKQHPWKLPAIEIVYPRNSKKEMRVLTSQEQTCFISYLHSDMDACKFGILLSLYTGIRIGEVCALQWKNISLSEGTIKISATMQRLRDTEQQSKTKTKIVISSPKSDHSTRIIPMNSAIAKLCYQMNPNNPEAYILTGTNDYIEPRTLQYRLRKYTRECGLEGVHFHTLRHTFATRCIEVGFEIKALSEILGHATTTITLDRYVHSSLEMKRNNMNKLNVVAL